MAPIKYEYQIIMQTHDEVYRKRCKRFDVYGHAHYLTFSCFGRQQFLTSSRACTWFLDALDAARRRRPFDLWAFVIMPEHAHLLLLPHEDISISKILGSIKIPIVRRAVSWVRKNSPEFLPRMADMQPNGEVHYRFWQRGGGYDRNIWNVKEIHEKIHYIHNNPVRRGLVSQPEDWPWSSYRAWEEEIDEPIRIDRKTLPPLEIL